MSWTDFHRRREICDEVIRQAARDPRAPLPFAEVPGAREYFCGEEELLLALHYQWAQVLSGHLRTELTELGGDTDRVDAATRAWRKAVARHTTLREVLDANLERHPALRARHEAELRMLAVAAGLAGPAEPADEVTRIGAAFAALLRHAPALEPAKPRNRVSALLRMLVPSA
ncbi:hypothetical protein FNH05_25860 [Amycolatopsis rhizosphaerae]|uniref:TetR/AcrR family transcriptional regulator n=1 Tax=Amycolatopsis rhizosphaerae TaxID=2053003 RepID=A0A558BHN5_9PSEU|nr:hypothetical protein [Amycolatopsis rhizosphaerae]TVT36031.1 hypothetical protein FNH05_25860 [Amycolatopsis rhizosphaerae]